MYEVLITDCIIPLISRANYMHLHMSVILTLHNVKVTSKIHAQ